MATHPIKQGLFDDNGSAGQTSKQSEKRAHILGAARALMYEKGFDVFSLRAVARASGYSPAGIYEYFDSKSALCSALAEDAWVRLGKFMHQAARKTSEPKERLVEICLAYIRFAAEYREDFLLLFSLLPSPRKNVDADIPRGSGLAALLSAITEASEAGLIDAQTALERSDVCYGLWSVAHGIAHLHSAHLADVEFDFTATNRVVLETMVAGYCKTPH